MRYSEKKFRKFSRSKQEEVILTFFRALEECWQDPGSRKELKSGLRDCLLWYGADQQLVTKLEQCFDLRDFLNLSVSWERKLGRDVRDPDFIIFDKDGSGIRTDPLPVYPVLIDLRSAFNTGAIFRTAECLNLARLYLCGYTPTPENQRLVSTAMGTERKVAWETRKDAGQLLDSLRKQQIRIYALETVAGSQTIFHTDFSFPCALVVGNEALGLDKQILEQADQVISIPVRGWKNSLNVATSFAVCAYEMFRKYDL